MGNLHRLPDTGHDDRRLIDVTVGELRALIAAEVKHVVGSRDTDDSPVSVKAAAKALKTGEGRVRDLCKHGCDECGELLPSTMTSDVRGRLIDLSEARAWYAIHRAAGGCRA
jgi:hypothetical protein